MDVTPQTHLLIAEAAHELQTSRSAIYGAIRRKALHGVRYMEKMLVSRAELADYKARTRQDGLKPRGRPINSRVAASVSQTRSGEQPADNEPPGDAVSPEGGSRKVSREQMLRELDEGFTWVSTASSTALENLKHLTDAQIEDVKERARSVRIAASKLERGCDLEFSRRVQR